MVGETTCVVPPQNENYRLRQFIQTDIKDVTCEYVPSPVSVTARLSSGYRQGGIQKQNSLSCPWRQIPGIRNGAACIVMQFLENIPKRRLNASSGADAECQSVRRARRVVRILSYNADFNSVRSRELQSPEDFILRRVDLDALPAEPVCFFRELNAFLQDIRLHDFAPFHVFCPFRGFGLFCIGQPFFISICLQIGKYACFHIRKIFVPGFFRFPQLSPCFRHIDYVFNIVSRR